MRVYEEMHRRFIYIFQKTFNKGVFPEGLKIAKITPIFKKGETVYLTTTSHVSKKKIKRANLK